MATVINDDQLDQELQELFIISNHWNSDVCFIQDEIRFLKNALNKYRPYTKYLQAGEAANFYKILETQTATTVAVKDKISVFTRSIEMFIIDPKKQLGLDMLERFNGLGTEIQSISQYTKLLRKLVLAFIEDIIRSGRSAKTALPVKSNPTYFKR